MSRFDILKAKLGKRPGVTNPGALAAFIGRKKYGNAGMARLSAAGRKKVRRKRRAVRRTPAQMAELRRDPGDLVLTGRGTAAQERKRDPGGYIG